MKNQLTSKIKDIIFGHQTAVWYFAIGVSASLVDVIGFFVLFNFFVVPATVSTAISVSLATIYSFVLNARFNFRVSDRLLSRFISFSGVSGVGLLLSMFALYVFHDRIGWDGNIVKIATLPVVFIVQYGLNRVISFRK